MEKLTAAALAAAFALGSHAHAANLITNGSFEHFDDAFEVFDGGNWKVYNALPGWTVEEGPGIELQTHDTVGFAPQHGTYYAELDSHPGPDSNSRIEQTIEGLDAGSYRLSFYYAPRTHDPHTNGIAFGAEGIGSHAVTGTSDPVREWQLVTYDFVVDAMGPVTIFFEAGGTADTLGGFVDNIQLEAVPLPGAAAFLLTGLAGLGMARRKRAA